MLIWCSLHASLQRAFLPPRPENCTLGHPVANVLASPAIQLLSVNEFNVETLLLCALPYHGTNEFVRLAQTLALDAASGWAWMSRMQGSGAALPREVLVNRCVNDPVRCVCMRGEGFPGFGYW